MIIKKTLAFDDVLLVPKYSEITSRSKVDLSVTLPKGFKFDFPVIPANMKDVVNIDVIKEMYKYKGLSIIHRFITISEQICVIQQLKSELGEDILNYLGISIGVNTNDPNYYGDISRFIDLGIKIICIDVAHADTKICNDITSYIHSSYPEVLLIVGNVVTLDAVIRLTNSGADIIKIGVGSGGICSTRVVSGNGVPQLAAIIDIYESLKFDLYKNQLNGKKVYLISDGGCRIGGDFVKSLCFSHLIMSGGWFAGSNECPGENVIIDNISYKRYDGSSTLKDNRHEGVKSLVHSKGPIKNQIEKIIEALQSGCSYQGVDNLNDLKENPIFIELTQAGIKESYPHDVKVIE